MDKLKVFLFWFLGFVLWDLLFEFIKSMVDNAVIGSSFFVFVIFALLAAGWLVVFALSKPVKNKKSVKNKGIMPGLVYFLIVCSVFSAFDMIRYFLDSNILNSWYFFAVAILLLFTGWVSGRLDYLFKK